jgi:multicomponent Na+:H+ antiporter subunit D
VVLYIVLPLAGAAATLAAKLPAVARRPVAVRRLLLLTPGVLAVGVALLAVTFLSVRTGRTLSYSLGDWPIPLGIVLEMDGLAWLSTALVYLLSLVISLYAVSYREFTPEFYVFYLLLVAGMQGVVLTTDVFNMFVSFEIIAIAAYVLIAYHRDGAALVAAYKYLILSSVGIFFFLFGAFVLYRELGTLAFSEISSLHAATEDPARLGVLRLALASLVVGVGVRTAFIPFHTWLPEAHAYAPHPVSALLSGVLIKVSFLAMVRIIRVFDAAIFADLLLWIGAVTAIVAVVWALSQRDVKKLLAYHSISQMGYVLAALGAAGALSLPAAIYHAVNHGLFKSLLFLAVGTAVYLTGERNVYRMPRLGGRVPLLALFFAVGALSIAGVPGFNGYASKAVVTAALGDSPAYRLLWLTGIGTVASFLKLSQIFGRGKDDGEASSQPGGEAGTPHAPDTRGTPGRDRLPAAAVVAMAVLAVLCVASGLAPGAIAAWLQGILASGSEVVSVSSPLTQEKLIDAGMVIGLGLVLYLLSRTAVGGRLTRGIESLAPQLRTVLLFFFAGAVGFAVVAVGA